MVCGLSLYLLMTAVVTQVVLGVSWGAVGAGEAYADFARRALAFEIPAGMIAANLGIATLIPICWVLMAIVHQVRPRWLSSVQPRLRWRYLLICAGVALVVLNAVTLIPLALGSTDVTVAPQAGFWGFLVVIVLTSPLQAAAEEIFFRGYLMQALGSLVAHPAFGVVVSALIFALMHGVQNPALFLNRLGFGLLAGTAGLADRRSGGGHRCARDQQHLRVRDRGPDQLDRGRARDQLHQLARLGDPARRVRASSLCSRC